MDLLTFLFFHHRSCALKLTNWKRRSTTLKELSTIHHGIGKLSTSFSLSWFENGQYLVVVWHNTIDLRACEELEINNYSRSRFKLILGSLCVVCAPLLSQIKSLFIFWLQFLRWFLFVAWVAAFSFHITIASDGASTTNIEYLLLKLNVKTSNFTGGNFLFLSFTTHPGNFAEGGKLPVPRSQLQSLGTGYCNLYEIVILSLVSHTQFRLCQCF